MVPWINGINEYLGIKLKYRKHINVLHDDFFVIQRRACKIVKYKQNHVSSKAIAHSKSEGFMAKYTTSKLVNHLSMLDNFFLQDQSCFVFILFLWMAEEKSDQGGAIYNAFPTTTTWR